MKADPPVRRDGRCACGCGRELPGVPKRRQKGIDDSVYTSDPFATNTCCRIFHGLDGEKRSGSTAKRAYVTTEVAAA